MTFSLIFEENWRKMVSYLNSILFYVFNIFKWFYIFLRNIIPYADLVLTEEQVKNFTLVEIEELLSRNGTSLRNFEGMPVPNNSVVKNGLNILIAEETSYDVHEMQAEFDRLFPCLTDEQRNVYETIMSSISSGGGGVFFLYGYGGTGKTFL